MKTLRTFLNETTLSRVYSHFNSTRPIAILTAFRGDFTYKDNIKRNKQLAALIKKAGYGYFFVDGHWVEYDGNNSDDSSEDSIFIIGDENDNGKLKGLATKWGKKYNQDAILFKDEQKDAKIELIFQNGSSESIGKFNPNKLAQAYTKLRGRSGHTFVFESVYVEKNWIGKIASK